MFALSADHISLFVMVKVGSPDKPPIFGTSPFIGELIREDTLEVFPFGFVTMMGKYSAFTPGDDSEVIVIQDDIDLRIILEAVVESYQDADVSSFVVVPPE